MTIDSDEANPPRSPAPSRERPLGALSDSVACGADLARFRASRVRNGSHLVVRALSCAAALGLVTGCDRKPPEDEPPIDAPVALVDVTASVLEWAGIEATSEIDGRPLPVGRVTPAGERNLLASY